MFSGVEIHVTDSSINAFSEASYLRHMNCMSGMELESAFLNEFDCQPYVSGRMKESRQRRKQREVAQSTLEKFKSVRPRVTSPEDAVVHVKEEMKTSMGPIAIFLLWTVFGAIIQKMVFWLWDHASVEIT